MKLRIPISIFVIFLIWVIHVPVHGQVTTVGKEFWLGFMDNNNTQGPDAAIIIISANEDTRGIIDLSGIQPGRVVEFELLKGQTFNFRSPSPELDLLHRTSGVIETKGIFIQAEGNISVYAFNERTRSADGTVILPTNVLGKDYWVTSHFEILPNIEDYPPTYTVLNDHNESLMLVVGVEDNTDIEITPSVETLDGKAANVPFTITLNKGQSYQLMAKADLTGSRARVLGDDINDCKNIAVYGGNRWTGVGQCGYANDHLFQQMYPVSTWGKNFIHVPLEERTSGELVKVIASENNTNLFLGGNLVQQLGAGEHTSLELGPNQVTTITADKPISVTVFSKSQECNDIGKEGYNQGDPFMITYSPNEQLLREVTFDAVSVVDIQDNNYVNIIVPTAHKDLTVLNGQNVGSTFRPVPGNSEFSYTRISIPSGSHSLSNPEGFIAYVYGFGYIESYGYSVGASLNNLNFETEVSYDFEVFGDHVACLDQTGTWTIEPDDPRFIYFQWDFGDGSDPKTGQTVEHTYQETGNYTIKITAAISESTCDSQEDIVFDVEVLESLGTISGESQVCPEVEVHEYEVTELENVERVIWSVEGGEIVGEKEGVVQVKWGAPNEAAKLFATPVAPNGCIGKPFEFTVKINRIIEPEPAVGEQEICFDPEQTHYYQVAKLLEMRGYTWHVEGGTIVSGGDGPEVEISWDQPGITGKVWYEEFSLDDELCSGSAEALVVEVNSAIKLVLEEKLDISCFGSNNGRIGMDISGGNGTYTYVWSHDSNLQSPIARDLGPGTYSLEVTDERGCLVASEDIIIDEPPLLEAILLESIPTSCFGRTDGTALLMITGGIGPYAINHPDSEFSGEDQVSLFQLAAGPNSFEISDQNGCVFVLEVPVESPEPLEVDVRTIKPTCPGASEGVLLATPLGGNGPFLYTWDLNGIQGAELTDISRGTYGITVEDERGCISKGEGMLMEEAPKVRMPTGFRPSDGGVNGIFEGISNCDLNFRLSIYNRWGQLIYAGDHGWDGHVDGKEAPPGTYTYLFEYNFIANDQFVQKQIRGGFTLLR